MARPTAPLYIVRLHDNFMGADPVSTTRCLSYETAISVIQERMVDHTKWEVDPREPGAWRSKDGYMSIRLRTEEVLV